MSIASKWNEWRADTVEGALELFAEITGGVVKHERADMISDLLCNLGHYCDRHGLDWEALVMQARRGLKHEREVGDEEYGDEEPPTK